MNNVKKMDLFATYETPDKLMDYVERYNKEERPLVMLGVGLGWNCLANQINKKVDLKEKVEQYHQLEQEIFDEISEKDKFSEECRCDNRSGFTMIHEGNWKEIQIFCINCRGYIEEK